MNQITAKRAFFSRAKSSPKPVFRQGEVKSLFLIFGLLLGFLSMATLSRFLYLDSHTTSLDAARAYLNYAQRNGSALILCGIPAFLLYELHRSGKQRIFEYWQETGLFNPLDILLRVGLCLLGGLAFVAFMYSYSTIKTRIPVITTYKFDVLFMEMDRVFFLGRDPWTLFSWIYDYPKILKSLDTVYDVWATVMVCTFLISFMRRNANFVERFRFPVALILTWFIGGNVLAIFLASAGPCYFPEVTGLPDVYAAQFEQLNLLHATQELRAITYQDLLWEVHENPGLGLGGISAMPSMHCATSFLFVLMFWKNKITRAAALSFFIVIFCGSFILGWHYAVDGLLAIPVALFGWWSAKKLLTFVYRGEDASDSLAA